MPDTPPPTVTGIRPDHGPEAGGTSVAITGVDLTGTTAVAFGAVPGTNVIIVSDGEITGTDFDGATAVSFGGTPANSFTVNSDASITAKAPPHAVGTVDVTVTNPAGTAGNSGLQYSKATGTYTFMWKTAKALAGTCQVFTLGLNDGTFHRASFKFS